MEAASIKHGLAALVAVGPQQRGRERQAGKVSEAEV